MSSTVSEQYTSKPCQKTVTRDGGSTQPSTRFSALVQSDSLSNATRNAPSTLTTSDEMLPAPFPQTSSSAAVPPGHVAISMSGELQGLGHGQELSRVSSSSGMSDSIILVPDPGHADAQILARIGLDRLFPAAKAPANPNPRREAIHKSPETPRNPQNKNRQETSMPSAHKHHKSETGKASEDSPGSPESWIMVEDPSEKSNSK